MGLNSCDFHQSASCRHDVLLEMYWDPLDDSAVSQPKHGYVSACNKGCKIETLKRGGLVDARVHEESGLNVVQTIENVSMGVVDGGRPVF